jgi:hypothetical protein
MGIDEIALVRLWREKRDEGGTARLFGKAHRTTPVPRNPQIAAATKKLSRPEEAPTETDLAAQAMLVRHGKLCGKIHAEQAADGDPLLLVIQ